MTIKKKIAAIAVAAAAVIGLSGCGDLALNGQLVSTVTVNVDDREVPCVVASSGGLDCDWEATR